MNARPEAGAPMLPMQPTPTPAPDRRTLLEIMLEIERKLTPVLPSASTRTITRTHPAPLSERQREVLQLVLEQCCRQGVKLDFKDVVTAANRIEADLFYEGGTTNDSIRNFCAELSGIKVTWSREVS